MPSATPSLRSCSLRTLRGAGTALAVAGLLATCAETLSFGHEHLVGGHSLHHSHFFFGDHEHHGHDDHDGDHDHDHGHGTPPHRHDPPRPTVTTSVVPALFQPAGAGEITAPPAESVLLGPAPAEQALLPPAVRPTLPRGPPPSPAPLSFPI
jgi:hypothetical protein